MRGKVGSIAVFYIRCGITPACAGKSGPISASGKAIRDHPRVCGEKALHDGGILPAQGSPPRVRGKVVVSRNLCLLSGITPACAGKSELQALVLSGQRDHPRVCGEKFFCRSLAAVTRGSPPRVRGKVLPRLLFLACIGITPACAGKRGHGRQSGRSAGDHPRVCGEKVCKEIAPLSVWGSPPRVRGKVLAALMPENRVGITPACAGKSSKNVDNSE